MLIGGSYPSVHAQNQTDASITGQGSLSFGLGIPTGDFNENTNNLGYGGNVYIGAEFPNSPVGVGIDFSVFAFGRNTRKAPFSETIPGVRVDVITTNTIVQPHLVLRLQPREGLVRPYAEGLFGFKYLFTDTRVQDERREDETIASSRNFDDFALSAGGAAGVHIRVAQGNPGSEQNSFRAIYLKLGLQYMWGREAEYLDISDGYNPDNPQVRQSNTTMLIPMIGVSFQF